MQPLRLRWDISTFPLLRLSEVEPITSAFHLHANSYIEVYNPDARAWEKEQVCAVRSVESQQRVLFRVCRSIMDSLEDSECPGLGGEIRLQEESKYASAVPLLYHPVDLTSQRKRSADELLTQPLSKHHRSHSAQSSVSIHTPANGIEGSATPPKHTEHKPEELIEVAAVEPVSASPTSSPSVSVTLPLATTTSTNGQSRQEPHYMPQTPISPMHYPSPSLGPMAVLPLRARDSIFSFKPPATISSESSLAMAVTPPTHTLSLQRSPASQSPTHPPPPRLPPPSPQAHVNPNPTPSPTPSSTPLPSTSRLLAPSNDRELTPATAKAWPHGKYVCEIDAGFAAMEATMAREPALKQPDAFRRVFGVPHKKSTVCSHKKVWKSAPQDMLAEWRARGREDGALWSEFVRAVEGKDAKRGAAAAAGMSAAGAGGAVAQSAAAFGSPQGGVLHLGAGARAGLGTAAGMRIQSAQGLGALRLEEPMASLRPPTILW